MPHTHLPKCAIIVKIQAQKRTFENFSIRLALAFPISGNPNRMIRGIRNVQLAAAQMPFGV